ncbi:hypothetical protein Sps_05166 [Shewanella psychrophila]|uniref:Uncharacterized protein n=1 Tax=Shewanella psychrophila TaxID=225848 RepID=A0A1S6HXF1_9GAMM|nr:hypothetical protein [Shewanella psychrophila]AQS40235.1 hypothetical protein Sps_05166 [Shewanella psychrophila]
MSSSYGWEKLHLAIHSLTGVPSQSERLVNALAFSLIHITPENDLPDSMQEEFRDFMAEMSSVGDGTYQATINSLDEVGIGNAIEKIISFYDTICRHNKPF